MAEQQPLRLGTRGSALARWQAEWVAGRLTDLGQRVELVPITTRGDARQQTSIGGIGEPGVFTKAIQQALLEDTIDLAVHSLKDLPTERVPGLALAAVPPRASAGDVLVAREADALAELPVGATVGTGSLRRKSQLLHLREDLDVRDVRGNVDTRLRKLDAGEYDALILAEAGLVRLGLEDRIRQRLPQDVMLPAVGQGALGIEARDDDGPTRAALAALDDLASHQAVTAERSLLAHLRGGCMAPLGATARGDGPRLRLTAVVLSADGRQKLTATEEGAPQGAAELGKQVAEELLRQGAAELIRAARESSD